MAGDKQHAITTPAPLLRDHASESPSAQAIAESLKLNTTLRGLSLARNQLTAASAETFGKLLAGGYEVSPAEIEQRSAVDIEIAAENKASQEATKKKKEQRPEIRPPLCELSRAEDGRMIAGSSRSLVMLNLGDNAELGSGGAVLALLQRLLQARKRERTQSGAGDSSVVLRELHLRHCQGHGHGNGKWEGKPSEESEDRSRSIAAASMALRPTIVYT